MLYGEETKKNYNNYLTYTISKKKLLTLGCNNNSKAKKKEKKIDDELNDLLTEDCLRKKRQVES